MVLKWCWARLQYDGTRFHPRTEKGILRRKCVDFSTSPSVRETKWLVEARQSSAAIWTIDLATVWAHNLTWYKPTAFLQRTGIHGTPWWRCTKDWEGVRSRSRIALRNCKSENYKTGYFATLVWDVCVLWFSLGELVLCVTWRQCSTRICVREWIHIWRSI